MAFQVGGFKTSSVAKTYYDKWLSVATNANVSYLAQYDPSIPGTLLRFTCKCGSTLELKPSDTVDMEIAVPFEVQEFAKLHKHNVIPSQKRYCPTCFDPVYQQWNRYLCMMGCHPAGEGWSLDQTLDAVPANGIPGAVSFKHNTLSDPKPAPGDTTVTYKVTYSATKPEWGDTVNFQPGQIVELDNGKTYLIGKTETNLITYHEQSAALKKSAVALKKHTGRRFR